MQFNSFEFFIFFQVVFFLYWFIFSKNKTTQNIFLLISSYLFYSFWDWRFTFLLAFSTGLDYFSAIIIENSSTIQKKKFWMRFSIIINIAILCYFKYFNFFVDSFVDLFNGLGFKIDPFILNITLPIGISFYTFHGVSYVLDIYYKRIQAHKNIIDYSLFVSYFPLLVAGPIERATHLLPQLKVKRVFNYSLAVVGCRFILWGMFKKVVLADSLAPIVDDIFNNYHIYNGFILLLGLVGFAFQVYGDFSGYTDIARGISKLFGIELILNFNFPYFSKSIPEFWSRWHISLSSWLNDYVFTPLALNFRNWGNHGMFLAVFLTFIISGLWHGASWHFIAWGAFHGILYIPSIYSKKGFKSIVKKRNEEVLSLRDIPSVILTFCLICFGYLLFRADGMKDALGYMKQIGVSFYTSPLMIFHLKNIFKLFDMFVYILPLLFVEWFLVNNITIVKVLQYRALRFVIYYIMLFYIIKYLFISNSSFIYFQF